MNRNLAILIAISMLALFLFSGSSTKGVSTDKEFRIMFYNVENLFDTIDSPLDDNEFLPSSIRRWDTYKYFTKLNSIAKVIVASGGWEAPALVGLCEVENENVLKDLTSKTLLEREGYKTYYASSEDRRGIGVGMIYKEDIELISADIFYPVLPGGDTIQTRSVLLATIGCSDDTLDVIISHWPSRRGGASATDPLREIIASLIKEIIIKAQENQDANKLIVIGDFNCNPDSYILSDILDVKSTSVKDLGRNSLVSLQLGNYPSDQGTYKFQGRWNQFDQLLISSSLIKSEKGFRYKPSSFQVFDNDNVLVKDISYKGLKPESSWVGPVYKGGYSDHLPIYFDLEFVN